MEQLDEIGQLKTKVSEAAKQFPVASLGKKVCKIDFCMNKHFFH
jgi:hypothetical protein